MGAGGHAWRVADGPAWRSLQVLRRMALARRP